MKFFIEFLEKASLYGQLLLFFVFHWYQKILRWFNTIFIKPLESIYDQYRPLEPDGHEWIQLYCLTKQHPFNEFGWNLSSYDHFEKTLYSHVDNFSAFLQKEHEIIVENPIVKLPYQYEFECQANLVELLFVVRKGDDYVIRNYSGLKPREKEMWEPFPTRSSFEFLFVEYYHPHMKETIELTIPDGLYLVKNELFTPAHIHRILYYTDRYFVFDLHYEIRFMDQNMEQHVNGSNNEHRLLEGSSWSPDSYRRHEFGSLAHRQLMMNSRLDNNYGRFNDENGYNENANMNGQVIRPPPGLETSQQNSVSQISLISRNLSECRQQGLPYLTSSSTSSVYSNFDNTSGRNIFMNTSQSCNDQFARSSSSSMEFSQRHVTTLPPISPLNHRQAPIPIGHERVMKHNNDEEIEANLLELGGQMAGSILDF